MRFASISCPASDHFWIRRHIGGVLPIGTALVTEFAPRRIRTTVIVMAVVGVALRDGLAGLVAAQFMSIYGSRARDQPARAAGAPSRPNRSPRAPASRCRFLADSVL
jgi:hypothetical protein